MLVIVCTDTVYPKDRHKTKQTAMGMYGSVLHRISLATIIKADGNAAVLSKRLIAVWVPSLFENTVKHTWDRTM